MKLAVEDHIQVFRDGQRFHPARPTCCVSKRAMCQSRAEAGATSDKQRRQSSNGRAVEPPSFLPVQGSTRQGWDRIFDSGGATPAPPPLRKTTRSGASILELHRNRFALRRLSDVEELPLLDVEHSCDDVRWESLDLGIQIAHYRIVITACVLDGIL